MNKTSSHKLKKPMRILLTILHPNSII